MGDKFSIIKSINDRLGDRISKEIYANKLMYTITGDHIYMRHIFDIIDNEYDVLPDFERHRNQPKVIFGCGKYGRFIKKSFSEIDWKCYVDNNATSGMKVEDIPVISVEELVRVYPDAYIVVSPRFDYENIARQLQQNSFEKDSIFLYGEKQDFFATKVYFDLPYLPHVQDEVFVDAGVLDGKSSCSFIEWAGGEYSHIHMFEPNADMHTIIRKNMERIPGGDKYTLHQKGLWDCEDLMKFWVDNDHLAGANFVKSSGDKCRVLNVSVIDLDRELQDDCVTFIKMDIEGAEKRALQGARKIIQQYRPKLAISIYHQPSDLWEIPDIILDINPKYDFYIRHYTLGVGDTVLYAI